jgi:hypothetical protein
LWIFLPNLAADLAENQGKYVPSSEWLVCAAKEYIIALIALKDFVFIVSIWLEMAQLA